MLVQIITENGQKKVIPLTADAGAGNPVGTIIPMYKKSSPSGYLYCDGSTFDQTKYPLLYAYLGSNVLPDYREFALVGAEENTTDVYNASTNPNGTIHDHDVYTEGQAKDDQLQDHSHYVNNANGGGSTKWVLSQTNGFSHNIATDSVNNGRAGTVTRGKRKAVFVYIKATSGLSENAQDNVINTLNEQRSYSTEEHLTGRKWIDGKPTYEKTIDLGALPNNTSKSVAHNISNLSHVVNVHGIAENSSSQALPLPYVYPPNVNYNVGIFRNGANITAETRADVSAYSAYVTIEYTKTTD